MRVGCVCSAITTLKKHTYTQTHKARDVAASIARGHERTPRPAASRGSRRRRAMDIWTCRNEHNTPREYEQQQQHRNIHLCDHLFLSSHPDRSHRRRPGGLCV